MKSWEAKKINRAVFLDRDGTINREVNYLHRREDLRLVPGTADALKLLGRMGFLRIIITNQSGIARGYYNHEALECIQNEILRRLKGQGADIEGFYHCPHHPMGKIREFAIKCDCRKPLPGMFLQAEKDFNLEMNRCWAIGDRIRDLIPAVNLGSRGILVLTGAGREELKNRHQWPVKVEFIARNLYQGAKFIAGEISNQVVT